MNPYFYPFLQALLVSAGIIFGLSKINFFRNLGSGRKSERHIHQMSVSRWGGLAIIASFWAVAGLRSELFFSQSIWGMAIGSAAILIFGIWDDFRELNWKIQLVFQILLAIFAYYWGIKTDYIGGGMINLSHYWAGLIFTVGWIILSINSMNWLDGVDGASAIVAFLGAITISLLALKPEVNQPPVAIIGAALSGAILGFLIFNFPPGKIMAGTSGSMFFGFILGSLAIFAGAKVATALLVMAVPIVDFGWVAGSRIGEGASVFAPDQRHWHHKLLKLGWSPRKIALFFGAITLAMVFLSLNTRLAGKAVSIVTAFILIAALRMLTDKKLAQLK